MIHSGGAALIYSKIADPMAAIQELGKLFHTSQIMGVNTPGDGAVLALTCMCEGITPLEFAKTYHIINGKPSMRADMMHAKFRAAGGKVEWVNLGDDNKAAEAKFTFDGQTISVRFTIDDARKLLGKGKDGKDRIDTADGNWSKDPPAMLRARLITKAIRILAPELIAGVYTPDELADYQPVTVTSSKPTESELQARRAELLAGSQNEPIIDAVIEQPSTTATTATTDESPFDSGPQLSTQAQRTELYALMQKLGKKQNPPTEYSAEQVGEQIILAGKGAFTSIDQAPKDLLDRMIARVRSLIS